MTSEPIYSFAVLRNRLELRGTLSALTALRVGAGRATEVTSNDLPVLRDALQRPFIPGASLKGVLRARAEALVRAVAPDQALDLEQIERRTGNEVARLKERIGRDDQVLSAALWRQATLIDLTFGSPELAARLFVRDALVDPTLWFGQFEVRNGVGIDRDTETVSEGLLYDYEVVPAGTQFAFALDMENAAPWQLGMVLALLRPWQDDAVQLGGFRSRGLGFVKLVMDTRRFVTVTDADAVLQLLGVTERAPNEISTEQEQDWIAAFADVLRDPARRLEGVPDA